MADIPPLAEVEEACSRDKPRVKRRGLSKLQTSDDGGRGGIFAVDTENHGLYDIFYRAWASQVYMRYLYYNAWVYQRRCHTCKFHKLTCSRCMRFRRRRLK